MHWAFYQRISAFVPNVLDMPVLSNTLAIRMLPRKERTIVAAAWRMPVESKAKKGR